MDGLLRAITCCVTTEGTLMLDPTTEEETAARVCGCGVCCYYIEFICVCYYYVESSCVC